LGLVLQYNNNTYSSNDISLRPHDSRNFFHFERQRLNQLFTEAARCPLVIVCAGAGYGKTTAVHDFVEEYKVPTAWIQLSERDNVGERFWENLVHSMTQINAAFSLAISRLGFPETMEKQNQYFAIIKKFLTPLERRILVLDDVHILENPVIVRLSERMINSLLIGTTIILISRSTPRQNITGMVSKGQVFNVSENDLCFTDNELAQYLRQMDIVPQPESLREIMQDTEGWAFAINLIARSYQKAPGYGGYLRSAMKMNIFQVMEKEIWADLSEQVKLFMVSISLIDHLSYELIELLAGGDKRLIDEMERQNAYIRRDSYINAYLIHPLFLEFLATKQDLLTAEQKHETYTIAGEWCNKNGFKIDAFFYYEKIGDYKSIVSIFYTYTQLPVDIAKNAMMIFDRAPEEVFDTVVSLGISRIRCYMRLGFWQKATELLKYYEEKYLQLPADDDFRNRSLGGLYYIWGYLRNFMGLSDGVFDFDLYYEKFCRYHPNPAALNMYAFRSRNVGPWIIANGSSKKDAPEEYINAVSRAAAILPQNLNGFMAGEDDLARGELAFFRGDMTAAETYIVQGLQKARDHRQYELQHRAHLYLIRMSVAQGNYRKGEQVIKELKAQLDNTDYPSRHINYDIGLALYFYAMDMAEMVPDWLKQNIVPYHHSSFLENFENQMKVRYRYIKRDYPPILAYVQEILHRESYLFGRVMMLSMAACIHYKMRDKEKAFATLAEAHEIASPNGIIMPFIEMGKDMRTLTASVLKEPGSDAGKIPKSWLENINRKAASYAKRQARVIWEYKQANCMAGEIILTPRETEILTDLSHGLSRAEIASSRDLSINTVKMVINMIYTKVGAENLADLIRITVEQKII